MAISHTYIAYICVTAHVIICIDAYIAIYDEHVQRTVVRDAMLCLFCYVHAAASKLDEDAAC